MHLAACFSVLLRLCIFIKGTKQKWEIKKAFVNTVNSIIRIPRVVAGVEQYEGWTQQLSLIWTTIRMTIDMLPIQQRKHQNVLCWIYQGLSAITVLRFPNRYIETLIHLLKGSQNIYLSDFVHRLRRLIYSHICICFEIGSIGTGILAMPQAFHRAGYLGGLVNTFLIGFICTYGLHIFVRMSHACLLPTSMSSFNLSFSVVPIAVPSVQEISLSTAHLSIGNENGPRRGPPSFPLDCPAFSRLDSE